MKGLGHQLSAAIVLAVVLVLGAVLLTNSQRGERIVTRLETIQGIPYPRLSTQTQILEALAHADVQLREPVFGKMLIVRVTYIPHASEELSAGIRENSFWLSYPRKIFYHAAGELQLSQPRRAELRFPLTTALQDKDRSVDLMFFAGSQPAQQLAEQKDTDHTYWELTDISAEIVSVWPTAPEAKDYVKSLITRERPL